MKIKKNLYKNKHNIIALDNIQLNTPYTFNYNPIKQHDGKVIRHDIIKSEFIKTFPSGWKYEYKVRMELSPKGRWHMHGIIYFKNYPIGFYSDLIPRIIQTGTLEIDTIKDINIWEQYMYKQVHCYADWKDMNDQLDYKSPGYNPKDYEDNRPIDETQIEGLCTDSDEDSEDDAEQ